VHSYTLMHDMQAVGRCPLPSCPLPLAPWSRSDSTLAVYCLYGLRGLGHRADFLLCRSRGTLLGIEVMSTQHDGISVLHVQTRKACISVVW
jgi:hypothetical protein